MTKKNVDEPQTIPVGNKLAMARVIRREAEVVDGHHRTLARVE